MGRHSHAGLVGGVAPWAFLFGVLVLPTTAVSQQVGVSDDTRFTAPVQQQSNQYGGGGYGTTSNRGGNSFSSEFANRMPPPSGYYGPQYGTGFGYGAHHGGMSPFDNEAPSQQPQGHVGGGQGENAVSSMQTPPMFGMGASRFPFPQQNRSSGYGTIDPEKVADLPQMAQGGGFHAPKGGYPRHACKHCMKHGGMATDLWQLFQIPDLSDEQREKIRNILDEVRRSHWELMGERMEHSVQLRRLYEAERLDAKAIGAESAKIFDVQKRMIESDIETSQKAMDVLTDKQREQFRSRRRWGM
uniref:Heavy-metal resistance n=1 Tax=Candidatus Kentrum sp. TUN TaxID=2126343 RepID=A0A450ZAH2_9GAMM|nr:MAG: Heavy-metal resistance [Candidatus Kentron sp. TUN]VFK51033.1 MAG: Heavy-metal resistance [Candidatus Kentron sp. TUN]VFK52017.1 MAG: Heavy-metal resistance [Candidatus Kentron sp. TUN]